MLNLLSSLPLQNKAASAAYLQTLLQVQARDLFTGLIHISGGAQQQAVLFYIQGAPILFYLFREGRWQAVARAQANAELEQLEGDMYVLALPSEGMRVLRLFLDVDSGEVNTFLSMPASEIPLKLNEWQAAQVPSLVHVRQQNADAFFVIAAAPANAPDALLVSAEHFQVGSGVLNQIKGWGERATQVNRFLTNLSSESGREYVLRGSFADLLHRILTGYQELAGRFLVMNLNEEVNQLNNERDWSIYFSGTNMVHRELFASADQAAQVYRTLLDKVDREMDLIVGPAVADHLIQTALLQLPPAERAVLYQDVVSKATIGQNIKEDIQL